MLSRSLVKNHFDRGIQRAKISLALYRHLIDNVPQALNVSDVLRGAIITSSSAFDLLHHQLVRALTYQSVQRGEGKHFVRVPIDIFSEDVQSQHLKIDLALQDENSHKSFLMPDKIGSLYTNLIPNFWERVSQEAAFSEAGVATAKIRELAKWRNRIVHESDINPDLGGIEEWPIYFEDVSNAVSDYETIGLATIEVGFVNLLT